MSNKKKVRKNKSLRTMGQIEAEWAAMQPTGHIASAATIGLRMLPPFLMHNPQTAHRIVRMAEHMGCGGNVAFLSPDSVFDGIIVCMGCGMSWNVDLSQDPDLLAWAVGVLTATDPSQYSDGTQIRR